MLTCKSRLTIQVEVCEKSVRTISSEIFETILHIVKVLSHYGYFSNLESWYEKGIFPKYKEAQA